MTKQKLNVKDKRLEQLDIEAGLLSSASTLRNFLVNKFDEVIKDKEE